MNRLAFVLLVLFGLAAQPALACDGDAAATHATHRFAGQGGHLAAVDAVGVASVHDCDCPARIDGAQLAESESGRLFLVPGTDAPADWLDLSFLELRRALDASSRIDSRAAPDPARPKYLLTARLRL